MHYCFLNANNYERKVNYLSAFLLLLYNVIEKTKPEILNKQVNVINFYLYFLFIWYISMLNFIKCLNQCIIKDNDLKVF